GKTAEFNAAYASPEGTIIAEDVDDLDGNVYRCIVAEHQSGKLDYVETVSNSATLHVGDKVTAADRTLNIEASRNVQTSDDELLAGAGDDVKVSAVLKDQSGRAIANETVYFALMDKEQDGKCIAYLSGTTDEEGKVDISFENVEVGSYEITALVKKQSGTYRAAVSNSIQLTVNESYDIVYELNGGINHNLNPVRYAEGSKYILLRDASREGYEFTGWYLDAELKHKVEDKWFDVSEHNGVLTLHAGWKEIEDDSNDPGGPNDPDDPAGPGAPEDDGSKPDEDAGGSDDGTDTGDKTSLAAAAAVMLAALGGAAAVLFGRRRTE
ncbi:MAG: InlB B-repeat-containing protein, partial [Firmicutes bacterium]|nr:InlB B-repeat-containing protein [Bacillota bacterium]